MPFFFLRNLTRQIAIFTSLLFICFQFTEEPSSWSIILTILRFLIVFLLDLVQWSTNKTNLKKNRIICSLLLVRLVLCFLRNNIFKFYVFFELSALFVFFIVLSSGYQPERVRARYYLILFTILRSLPFLMNVILLLEKIWVRNFHVLIFSAQPIYELHTPILVLAFMVGILVKFPLYVFHIWLPKAHVEASALGSIILAAILLKLGVYGFMRIRSILRGQQLNFLFSFSLVGAWIVSFLCLRARDFKIVIAYSSVAHIGFIISALITRTFWRDLGALRVRIAHGFVSRALFFGAGLLYSLRGSRLLTFNRSLLLLAPWFSVTWACFCIINIGTPPALNFWGELFLIFGLTGYHKTAFCFFSGPLFLSVAFRVLLYSSLQTQKEIRPFLTSISFYRKDMLIMLLHLIFATLYIWVLVLFFE